LKPRAYTQAGELTYDQGSRVGPSRTIWKSGNTLSEGSYLANVPHGPWRFYYADGQLFIDCAFDAGVLDGAYRDYYEDGTPRSEGTYDAGIRLDDWTCWNEAGEIEECSP
jgi:antitoxin component YwqK of YwqJK toxin-antitoxin module